MIQIVCVAVLVGMTSAMIASAQSPAEVGTGERVAKPFEPATQIRLDGRLDESAWQPARPIGVLRQREPVENAEPSEETIVRVLYNDDALYIGIVSQPGSGESSRTEIRPVPVGTRSSVPMCDLPRRLSPAALAHR